MVFYRQVSDVTHFNILDQSEQHFLNDIQYNMILIDTRGIPVLHLFVYF